MEPIKGVLAAVLGLAGAMTAGAQSATALLGATIQDERGNEVGEIADLLIEDGTIVAVELVPGPSLGLEGERIEVPYESLQIGSEGDIVVARSQVVLLASADAADPSRDEQGRGADVSRRQGGQGAGDGSQGPRRDAAGRDSSAEEQADAAQAPETIDTLDVDPELAEIDPRLAEGIEANEEAFDTNLDEESFDNDDEARRDPEAVAPEPD